MVLYLSILFVAMAIVTLINIFAFPDAQLMSALGWGGVILMVVFAVIVEIAIDGIVAFICERFPSKLFEGDKNRLMNVSKREQRFYERIGIKHWKDKVWELGGLGGFRKNKISNPNDPQYLGKFIAEVGKGMVGHIVSLFAGFLVIFCLPLRFWLKVGVPVAFVGFLLNLMPLMILRYNLPKLKVAKARAERLASRGETSVIADVNTKNDDSKIGLDTK